MSDIAQNLVVTTLAKGATAQLREVIKVCDDRETARMIHAELMRLANDLARKHNFGQRKEPFVEKIPDRMMKL
jgi:hypothetical protein